jgi:hypothetical protein
MKTHGNAVGFRGRCDRSLRSLEVEPVAVFLPAVVTLADDRQVGAPTVRVQDLDGPIDVHSDGLSVRTGSPGEHDVVGVVPLHHVRLPVERHQGAVLGSVHLLLEVADVGSCLGVHSGPRAGLVAPRGQGGCDHDDGDEGGEGLHHGNSVPVCGFGLRLLRTLVTIIHHI